MAQITVRLSYHATMYPSGLASGGMRLALPLRILDADGTVVSEGAVDSRRLAHFEVPDDYGNLFVRLTWPSGRTETKKADVGAGDAWLDFSDEKIAHNEWSAWAVPQLSKQTVLAKPDGASMLDIGKFDRVWLRLWTLRNGAWMPGPVPSDSSYRNQWARQLDLSLSAHEPHMLQLGGASLPWRLVSLPGGECRVLLAPNESSDPRAERLKVVVTGFRREAETLLEFLVRDRLREAAAMSSLGPLSIQLIAAKQFDPVSAVAAAYFQLRTDWRAVPIDGYRNLVSAGDWLVDPVIILCVARVRAGLDSPAAVEEIIGDLQAALARGLPLFAESVALLQELASTLQSAEARHYPVFRYIERLAVAQAWSGATLSFYGADPVSPSAERLVGMPERGRHLKKASRREQSDGLFTRAIDVVRRPRVQITYEVAAELATDDSPDVPLRIAAPKKIVAKKLAKKATMKKAASRPTAKKGAAKKAPKKTLKPAVKRAAAPDFPALRARRPVFSERADDAAPSPSSDGGGIEQIASVASPSSFGAYTLLKNL